LPASAFPTSFVPEPEGPSLPQHPADEEDAAEADGVFDLASQPLIVERRWDRIGLFLGFGSGFVGMIIGTVLYKCFGSDSRPWEAVLGGLVCLAPIAGMFAAAFFATALITILPAIRFFRGGTEAEERALETAMDEYDSVGRKWVADRGEADPTSGEDGGRGDGPADSNVRAMGDIAPE
jgi:hypothetical protein